MDELIVPVLAIVIGLGIILALRWAWMWYTGMSVTHQLLRELILEIKEQRIVMMGRKRAAQPDAPSEQP